MIIWPDARQIRLVPLVLVLVAAPSVVYAASDVPVTVEIVEFGTYAVTNRINGERDANGERGYVGAHDLIKRTDQICARLKTTFAIEYMITSADDAVVVTVVTVFPPDGIVNDQGVRLASNAQTTRRAVGERFIRSFTFDEPFEMVTGQWTFEIRHRDRVAATKAFTVRNCDPIS
jgi:Domain of unknown function (DUF3859)